MSSTKNKVTSPTKRANGSQQQQQQQQIQDAIDYNDLNKELVRGLSEKEVENEHLKTTVVALNEKIEVINDFRRDVDTHKELLKHSEEKRTELQIHITETSIKIQEDTTEHNSYQENLIQENDRLKVEISTLKTHQGKREQDHLKTIEDMNLAHKSQIDQITSDNFNKVTNLTNEHNSKLDKMQRENHERYQALTKDSSDKLASITKENSDKLSALTKESNEKISALTKESNDKISALTKENTDKLAAMNKEHTEKLSAMNKENTDKLSALTKESNDKIAKMSNDFQNKMEESKREFATKLDQQSHENKQKLDSLNQEKENLRLQRDAQIRVLNEEKEEQRLTYEKKIDELELLIKKQKQSILELTSTIISLKEVITQKSDVEDQLNHGKVQIGQIDSQKIQMQRELETASDYILELEDKVYRANKTSLELLRQLKDAEVEIETLKNYIIELKQRIAVYIPVKDDPIDKRLAEFINNYPERQKLKIMFMRESEGVYQFGTKRCAVRVDKDKINIRVGGGYLSIDEFLDQYTPNELEKLERKDPLKKFSEKIAIQKTIVGKEVRESSPIRSPSRGSPTRKVQ